MSDRIKVRGAHSGFMKDGYAHTDSNVACSRVMLLRAHGVQEEHDAATLARFAIGHGNEDYYCDTFLAGLDIQRDVNVTRGDFEGHADVIYGDTVYELKSVTSKFVWGKVQKGEPKLSNLAQLIGYMWAAQRPNGVLAYTFYEDSKPTHTRQFAVKLTDKGNIVVDGVYSEYTLADWRAHHKYMVEDLNSTQLHPDQPINPKDTFATPCTWCPFSSVCDTFNPFKSSTKDFVESARAALKVNKASVDEDSKAATATKENA